MIVDVKRSRKSESRRVLALVTCLLFGSLVAVYFAARHAFQASPEDSTTSVVGKDELVHSASEAIGSQRSNQVARVETQPVSLTEWAAAPALGLVGSYPVQEAPAQAAPAQAAPAEQAAPPAVPATQDAPEPPAEDEEVVEEVATETQDAVVAPTLVDVSVEAEPTQDAAEGDDETKAAEEKEEKKKPSKPGIPVTNQLVKQYCSACHEQNDEGHMSRISYSRKSPEGWELSLKRMIRLNNVVVEPEEAKEIVRYLANDHGLTRNEAKQSLYDAERRVHWSEEEHDEAMRESCAECHTLGRVFSQYRDEDEWKHLKNTHLAFFPLAQWQAFGSRGRWRGGDGENEGGGQRPRGDRADQVLAELAKSQPLMTPEWESWSVNRREVPVAGTWTVLGHEIGRGDLVGTVEIRRVEEDGFETTWKLTRGDGSQMEREGKGLLYAGYSWRGRSTSTAEGEPESLREVLLLSDDWNHFEGRLFYGGYNEIGVDVELFRQTQNPTVFGVEGGELVIPSTAEVVVHGTGFAESLSPADFHLGAGITVTNVARASSSKATLTVEVGPTTPGKREVSIGPKRGPEAILLYDTIDYVRIEPTEGFSRVGGTMRPKQIERFEGVAMNRGADGKLWTDDDVRIKVVPVRWSLEEFPVRPNDDDLAYVGQLDPTTGVFTPGLDGPNPSRRWQANNIGDVYVVAETTLSVPVRPDEDADPYQSAAEVTFEEREFRARGHLLVTVPLYVQWDRFEWDQR